MLKRTGLKKKPSCCFGLSRSTVEEKRSLLESSERMIGSKLLDLFQAEMTLNVNTSSTRTKKAISKRATG